MLAILVSLSFSLRNRSFDRIALIDRPLLQASESSSDFVISSPQFVHVELPSMDDTVGVTMTSLVNSPKACRHTEPLLPYKASTLVRGLSPAPGEVVWKVAFHRTIDIRDNQTQLKSSMIMLNTLTRV